MKITIKLSSGKAIELTAKELKELQDQLADEKKEFVPWPYPIYPSQPSYPWSTPWYSKPWGTALGGSAGGMAINCGTTTIANAGAWLNTTHVEG